MITFDGSRSKKLLWFAKKKLAQIKSMGLPSSAVKYNGFLIRVWQLANNLSGGRITAPMGAVVVYTNYDGVQVLKADHWLGSIDSRVEYHTLYKGAPVYALFPYVDEASMTAAGYSTWKLIPDEYTGSPYPMLYPPGVLPPAPTYEYDHVPVPGVQGLLGGEGFWISYTGYVATTDFLIRTDMDDTSMTFYSSDGGNLGGRNEVYAEDSRVGGVFVNWGSSWPLPSSTNDIVFVSAKTKQKYQWLSLYGDPAPVPTTYPVTAIVKQCNTDGVRYDLFFLSVQSSRMPAGLVANMILPTSICKSTGNYVYALEVDGNPILMQMVDITNRRLGVVVDPTAPEEVYLTANPVYDPWRLSIHFYLRDLTGGGGDWVWSISSTQFMPILDTLTQHIVSVPGEPPYPLPSADWEVALHMLVQLIGRPNHHWEVPYDTVSFHDGNGDVYTWSRLYGSFRFYRIGAAGVGNTAALQHMNGVGPNPPPIDVGTAVGTSGDRPTITYAGSGLYLMVSERLEPSWLVLAIDVGDPFGGGWTSIPLPTVVTDNLVYVRPIRVILDDMVLMGVIEDALGDYYLAILFYTDWTTTPVGEWEKLSKVPVEPYVVRGGGDPFPSVPESVDRASWSVALFGDGILAREMNEYLTQQQIMPQMPVPTSYSLYSAGMP